MRTTTETFNFTLANDSVLTDMAWVDDSWVDRKDALDCETVRFDETIEIGLCERMWQDDLVDSGHYEPEYPGNMEWED